MVIALTLCGAALTAKAQKPREFSVNEFRHHQNFRSQFLKKGREVLVFLPPGYNTETTRRYPVLYMHDGANIFLDWRIDETAKALINAREIEPLIIVGVFNGGTSEERFIDYTPTRDARYRGGSGEADRYGRMLVEELKPFIDSEYRTLPDATHTALGGTSLGGLVTLYFGLKYPETFGKLAVMSPSVAWDNKMIVRNVKALKAKHASRIWLDIGDGEGQASVSSVRELRDALTAKGWLLNSDLNYYEAKGAQHNDKAWGERAGLVLKYLFPAATRSSSNNQ
ncbi:MAG: alpha/beta hydrolase [Pyrinomonadaceae bacterium]